MDQETEKEIGRLSRELAETRKELHSLKLELREKPVLSPAGTQEESDALKLLQYLETNGRLKTDQAKKILKTNQHERVTRAMRFLDRKYDEVNFRPRRRKNDRLILECKCSLHSLHNVVQPELCNQL